MLLGILGANLLGSLLERRVIQTNGAIRPGQDF